MNINQGQLYKDITLRLVLKSMPLLWTNPISCPKIHKMPRLLNCCSEWRRTFNVLYDIDLLAHINHWWVELHSFCWWICNFLAESFNLMYYMTIFDEFWKIDLYWPFLTQIVCEKSVEWLVTQCVAPQYFQITQVVNIFHCFFRYLMKWAIFIFILFFTNNGGRGTPRKLETKL